MKKLRWQILIILLTGLVVGVLLIAEQRNGTPTVQTAPTPEQGGSYTEALVGSFSRLNPLLAFFQPADRDVNRLLFSGLIQFDDRGNPTGDLAESFGASQDGTIYNVQLRPDLKWHDGQPLTGDDVVFTVELMRNAGDVLPQDLQDMWKKVQVISDGKQIVQFSLPEAFAPFLDYLNFAILPKHLLEGKTIDEIIDDNFNMAPVGSGPYRFERLIVEGEEIKGVVLTAFDGYYGKAPYLEQVVFRYFPDSFSAYAAYKDGLVQGISQVTPDVLEDVLKDPDLSLYTSRLPQLTMVLFNLKEGQTPFFQDADVRKALLMGLNRRNMIRDVLQGQAAVADGVIFPGTWAYYDGIAPVDYDPTGAADLLKNAGYVLPAENEAVRKKDDVSLSFTLIFPDDDIHRQLAEAIQADWGKLNVSVNLEALPYEQLIYDRLEPREYQAALIDLNLALTPDPDPYPFWDQVQAETGQNYSQWDNRVVSEYLEQARVTIDQTERARLYRNFQVLFANEMPALPLYYPMYSFAVDRAVRGVTVGPLFDTSDRLASLTEWYLPGQKASQTTTTP